jgi:hypothetical protein
LSIATIKDGKIIRSDCTELFMDSNENDLKRWVDTTILEDICSHDNFKLNELCTNETYD